MTTQALTKPPKTRHEMMAAGFYHYRIMGRCATGGKTALWFQALRGSPGVLCDAPSPIVP